MSSLVKNNTEYVWVVDDKTTNINALGKIDQRIGYQLQSIEGVATVHPLVVASGLAKFNNGKSAGVTLIGVEVPAYAGGPWRLFNGSKEAIIEQGAVITDYFDRGSFGGLNPGEYFEINGKKVFNAAQTKGVRSFGGIYTFTTVERARYLGGFDLNKSSAFLLTLKDPTQKAQVINRINATMGNVKAWSSEDLATATILTVLKTSGIAISFGTLIVFALIVGFVIIGLTLYSAAIDRIKDYGTLKAIGADNSYIRKLILTQATIIAILGYLIGTALVEGFRNGIANAGTYFNYPIWLRVSFFIITVIIALFGSRFAIKRIVSLEPAAVFRG